MKDPDLRQFDKRIKLKKPNSLDITLIIPEIRSEKRRKKNLQHLSTMRERNKPASNFLTTSIFLLYPSTCQNIQSDVH